MQGYIDSVINAKVFAKKFRELCKDFISPIRSTDRQTNIQTAKCNKEIIGFLAKIHQSIHRGRCDEKTFMEQIFKMNHSDLLPLDIWWYLLKCHLILGEDLVMVLNQNRHQLIAKHFSLCLFKNIFQDVRQKSSILNNMNSDFMKILLTQKSSCDLNQCECNVYNLLLKDFSEYCLSNKNSLQNINTNRFYDTLKISSLDCSLIKPFILSFIEISLNGKPISLQEVLHTSEVFLKSEKPLFKNKLNILNFIELHETLDVLKKVFLCSSQSMNWENLYYLLTCITNHFEHSHAEMKVLINFLLQEALTNLKKDLLLYAFILARHCSFPPVPNFPSYLQWFSSTFSSESSRPINSKEKSVFFMDFLTQAAKFDAPCYLKVHINRIPKLPMECHSLVTDYVKLVKTILIDLNESSELGIFDNISNKKSAEFDVETVLNIFSNTNEVPKCVLEAAVFCKLYYENKFLVTLLSKNEGENSVRHKLIQKLHKLGKIPNTLFLKYQQLYK